MSDAAVAEFPFVQDMPKREKSRMARLWDHFHEVRAVVDQFGMVLPQHYAADLLGISRQRVHTLVNEGRLHSVEIAGCRYVTENSLLDYAQAERTGGRPVKVPTVRECFSKAQAFVREAPEKK